MFAKREWMRKGKSERERVKEIEREKKMTEREIVDRDNEWGKRL